MLCEKCGKKIKGDANFCEYCGEPLKKKTVTKYAKVKGVVVAVVVICIISLMILLNDNEAKYNNKIAEADQYLNELEYDKAETAYLEAIKIDRKQEPAYIKLADMYVENDRDEDAEDIVEEGKENIEEPSCEFLIVYNRLVNSEQYEAYYDLAAKYQNKYGSAWYDTFDDDRYGTLQGLCIVKLFDFDQDGSEELILGYIEKDEYGIESFNYEVWAWCDNKLCNVLPPVSCSQATDVWGGVITAVKDESIFLMVESQYMTGPEYDIENRMLNNSVVYMQYDGDTFSKKYTSVIAQNYIKTKYIVDGITVDTQKEYEELMKDLPQTKAYYPYEEDEFLEQENGILRMEIAGCIEYVRSIISETSVNMNTLKECAK